MKWDQEEFLDRQEQVNREVSSINRKWESPELNHKLAEGDAATIWQRDLDYMRQRELRNGCFDR